MRKVMTAFICIAVSTIFLSQTAQARTQASVSIGTPGFYFEASNVRHCPTYVCVEKKHHWYGGHRMCPPGRWAYAPGHHRYVPAHRWHRDGYTGHDRFVRGHDRDRNHRDNDRGGPGGPRGDRDGRRN